MLALLHIGHDDDILIVYVSWDWRVKARLFEMGPSTLTKVEGV